MDADKEKIGGVRWQGWLLAACVATAIGLMTVGYWMAPIERAARPGSAGSLTTSTVPSGVSQRPAVRFSVAQRSGASLPIPEGGRIRLGDITRGRVSISIANAENRLVADGVMRPGMRIQFFVSDVGYWLELVDLDNHLIGTDRATFSLTAGQQQLTDDQKISHLINFVKEIKDATFIRNGDTYAPDAAADHLRRKLSNAGRPMTAEQFISGIASRSSSSGEIYRVRYADGHEVPVEQLLREEVGRLERGER